MSAVNLLVTVLVLLLLFHLLGGVLVTPYRELPYYMPGSYALVTIVLLVFILSRL